MIKLSSTDFYNLFNVKNCKTTQAKTNVKKYINKYQTLAKKHKKHQLIGTRLKLNTGGYLLFMAELAKKYKIVEPIFLSNSNSLLFCA